MSVRLDRTNSTALTIEEHRFKGCLVYLPELHELACVRMLKSALPIRADRWPNAEQDSVGGNFPAVPDPNEVPIQLEGYPFRFEDTAEIPHDVD